MNRFTIATLFLLLACTSSASNGGDVKNSKLNAESFHGQVEIDASTQDIWKVVSNAKSLCALLNYELMSGATDFQKPGDYIRAKSWGDASTMIPTMVVPNEELRFGFDPDNASYFCNQRWVLTPKGKKVVVQFTLTYTESGTQSEEDIKNR